MIPMWALTHSFELALIVPIALVAALAWLAIGIDLSRWSDIRNRVPKPELIGNGFAASSAWPGLRLILGEEGG